MMLPALTTSPPNFLTPKRLLLLSRPFRELPCPFLCAMMNLWLSVDLFDLNQGQLLAMTDGFLIALTPSHLEAGDLGSFFV